LIIWETNLVSRLVLGPCRDLKGNLEDEETLTTLDNVTITSLK